MNSPSKCPQCGDGEYGYICAACQSWLREAAEPKPTHSRSECPRCGENHHDTAACSDGVSPMSALPFPQRPLPKRAAPSELATSSRYSGDRTNEQTSLEPAPSEPANFAQVSLTKDGVRVKEPAPQAEVAREWWIFCEDLIERSGAPDGHDADDYVHVVEHSAYVEAIASWEDAKTLCERLEADRDNAIAERDKFKRLRDEKVGDIVYLQGEVERLKDSTAWANSLLVPGLILERDRLRAALELLANIGCYSCADEARAALAGEKE